MYGDRSRSGPSPPFPLFSLHMRISKCHSLLDLWELYYIYLCVCVMILNQFYFLETNTKQQNKNEHFDGSYNSVCIYAEWHRNLRLLACHWHSSNHLTRRRKRSEQKSYQHKTYSHQRKGENTSVNCLQLYDDHTNRFMSH